MPSWKSSPEPSDSVFSLNSKIEFSSLVHPLNALLAEFYRILNNSASLCVLSSAQFYLQGVQQP
jgi:hypothetical protein